jgi:hypothetical protein
VPAAWEQVGVMVTVNCCVDCVQLYPPPLVPCVASYCTRHR